MNTEQARAFRIIAKHSQSPSNEPLKMYIGGPGGTGKSRVIDSLREYFTRSGQQRQFRLASYTGVAATNIAGMTLHAALCLNQRNHKKGSSKTTQDLISMWQEVDYLFIDEISMIGCSLLLQISEALGEAKGNTLPFGNINIILAGDFCQLPPIGQTRLFTKLDTSSYESASKRGQNDILGKLLWLSISTVVIFQDIMRQKGKDNVPFVELLNRLREGRCIDKDFDLLNKRIINNVLIDWKSFRDVPIIVSDNVTKDAINVKATEAFAKRSGQDLHWYYATDTRGGKKIDDTELENHLLDLNSGQTNQRLGKIPLVIGMPIIVTQNFDVNGGIVNGTMGILKQICYYTDNQDRRHAVSCIVESPTIKGTPLPNLSQYEGAILEDTVDMNFIHPFSKKKCVIKRTQVPLAPTFAMTTYKAQGRTLQTAIVDLQSCKGQRLHT